MEEDITDRWKHENKAEIFKVESKRLGIKLKVGENKVGQTRDNFAYYASEFGIYSTVSIKILKIFQCWNDMSIMVFQEH